MILLFPAVKNHKCYKVMKQDVPQFSVILEFL